MSADAPKIDSLRERLAAPELREAREMFAHAGMAGLVTHAHRALEKGQAARARLEALSRQLDTGAQADRPRAIERYLQETAESTGALKEDLRALRAGQVGVLDLAALGERVARLEDRCERAAEVTLALARAAFSPADVPSLDMTQLWALAISAGRWSRRVEACGLLGVIGPHTAGEGRTAIAALLQRLADRSEQRWVQPAAIAALAAIDPPAARNLAEERLLRPDSGDDFLVRARIVQMVKRFREAGFASLLAISLQDPSDLVRLETARAQTEQGPLERTAREDASHKVRAVALIALAERFTAAAQPALERALVEDPHGFVVQTAAEELVALAHKGPMARPQELLEALVRGASRTDIGASSRAVCRDALVEIDVLTSVIHRSTYGVLAPIVAKIPAGGAARIQGKAFGTLTDEDLGRVLSVLAKDDLPLGIDRTDGGIVLYRGESRQFAPWRALFEILHPAPSKRQAFVHTSGRKPRGALRAPPGGMAELTATRVPGERVVIDRLGEWGRHLPLVDDLLSTGVFLPKKVTLASPFGSATLAPPPSFGARLGAWLKLTWQYPRFVDLRRRALESDEPATQTAYLNEVASATGIRIELSPFTFGGRRRHALPLPTELLPSVSQQGMELPAAETERSIAPLLLAGAAGGIESLVARGRETWHDLLGYAMSPGGNRLPHLAGYALVLLGGMVVRAIAIRRSIEQDRRAIPLVIGGWGTRGKSGTERLKAGLFQGLGHEVLVKTTGCEAMFIHAMPGVPAREIFIYRPYDKATVWEQSEVLRLGRKLGVRVFLWECMALQPDLVNLLQQQWMQDDCSTITNAYPDHEDVQGPAGVDVATVISEFVPRKGRLFTAEDQMLPILRERARERGTQLRVVGAREAELIADDLLARFPYQEHPKNVALVTALARSLGVSGTLAITEMADNVVPDLGVLKVYPTVPWRGRTLSFANGMSANERTGALANWRRTGFDKHDPDSEPARWIVTVVNNRADRIARSEVFARFLVEDIAAHKHVLIGTNVGGLVGFLREALERHIVASSVTTNLAGSDAEKLRTAEVRLERAFAKLKIGRTDAESVLAEQRALGFPELPRDHAEHLLSPARPGEPYEAAKLAVLEGIGAYADEERRPFAVAMIARRRTVRALMLLLRERLSADPAAVDQAFGAAYRALFEEGMVALHDASLTGDQIIDRIAELVPPAAHASIQGVQNIKGTGLDFVYRWVSIDMVERALRRLASPSREQRVQALRDLLVHDDYGLVDATVALQAVETARAGDPEAAASYDAAAAKLREVVSVRTARLRAKGKSTVIDNLRAFVGETLDFVDAVRRRGMASDLVRGLVAGRVSHAAAAVRMREVVARSKGAWMKSRS